MTWDLMLAAVLCVGIAAYLVWAMLRPEDF